MDDFNAKSSLWGQIKTDCRGRHVAAFGSNADLEIIINPESTPTFSGLKGISWIDILFVRHCARRIAD